MTVAISRHCSGLMAVGSRCLVFWRKEQAFICSTMSTE